MKPYALQETYPSGSNTLLERYRCRILAAHVLLEKSRNLLAKNRKTPEAFELEQQIFECLTEEA